MVNKKPTIRELIAARDSRRRAEKERLKVEYDAHIINRKRLSARWEGISGEKDFFSIDPWEEYEKNGLSKWENEQPVIISGKYRDSKKILAEYQQRFVETLRGCTPGVIEELRFLGKYFTELFNEEGKAFHSIFDLYRVNLIYSDQGLDLFVGKLLDEDRLLDFRPWHLRHHPFDFGWGDYRLLIYFFYLSLPGTPRETVEQVKKETISLVQQGLEFRSDILPYLRETDESRLRNYIASTAERVVNDFMRSDAQDRYFIETARDQLSRFFHSDSSSSNNTKVEVFIILHAQILMWSAKHKLEKDWILSYAYYLTSEFVSVPDISVGELKIAPLWIRELVTDVFKFEYTNWYPGDLSKDEYEEKLREAFDLELEKHFQWWGRYLKLDRGRPDGRKSVTRPMDPDRIRWLIAWNEGATYKEIGEAFGRSPEAVETAIQGLAKYSLPIRFGRKGMKKGRIVSAERLAEIRGAK